MKLVSAYDKRTGKKLAHQVPERWLDHPKFGKNLTRTPRQKAVDRSAASATDKKKAAPTAPTNAPAAGAEKE